MLLTNDASSALIMLLGRFDYNREGRFAEEYRIRLLRLSERHAAVMSGKNRRPLIFAEDVYRAAFMLEEEVVM